MEFIAGKNEANSRIDKILKRMLNAAPSSFIYKMFRNKDVKVNGKKVKFDYILKEGDEVSIYLKDELYQKFRTGEDSFKKVKFDIPIIYEDENILIVNKPRGILVHGDENEKSNTLQNKFLNYLYSKGEFDPKNTTNFTPGPVHRLDRNTSGICILAKNLAASKELLTLFRERDEIRKTYLALVCGQTPAEGRIDLPLIKNPETNQVSVGKIEKGAKTAITIYQRKKCYSDCSLVEVELLTGRTHQIRAHFQAIHHPIVGDSKYGDFEMNKIFYDLYRFKDQFLHAYSFEFLNIEGMLSYLSNRKFIAPLPSKEKDILDSLKL